MSELEEAIARLERAVARLEAARAPDPQLRSDPERAADGEKQREMTAAIVARVDAALERIGQVLGGEG
jgi:hypothetical protein